MWKSIILIPLCYHSVASTLWALGFGLALGGMGGFEAAERAEYGQWLFVLHSIMMLPATVLSYLTSSQDMSFFTYFSKGELGPLPTVMTLVTSFLVGLLWLKLRGTKQS